MAKYKELVTHEQLIASLVSFNGERAGSKATGAAEFLRLWVDKQLKIKRISAVGLLNKRIRDYRILAFKLKGKV